MKLKIIIVTVFLINATVATVWADIDLFKPFLKLRKETEIQPKLLSPLQKLKLSEINLKGIIWNTSNPLALIEDSVGKGYIIKRGDLIGANGRVKEIKKDRVIIIERYIDVFEGEKIKVIELVLPKKEAILP